MACMGVSAHGRGVDQQKHTMQKSSEGESNFTETAGFLSDCWHHFSENVATMTQVKRSMQQMQMQQTTTINHGKFDSWVE